MFKLSQQITKFNSTKSSINFERFRNYRIILHFTPTRCTSQTNFNYHNFLNQIEIKAHFE